MPLPELSPGQAIATVHVVPIFPWTKLGVRGSVTHPLEGVTLPYDGVASYVVVEISDDCDNDAVQLGLQGRLYAVKVYALSPLRLT